MLFLGAWISVHITLPVSTWPKPEKLMIQPLDQIRWWLLVTCHLCCTYAKKNAVSGGFSEMKGFLRAWSYTAEVTESFAAVFRQSKGGLRSLDIEKLSYPVMTTKSEMPCLCFSFFSSIITTSPVWRFSNSSQISPVRSWLNWWCSWHR